MNPHFEELDEAFFAFVISYSQRKEKSSFSTKFRDSL